jgi:hypothetical protein
MIVSNYTKLFSIEFLHEAYRDKADIIRDINIIPDENTTQILNGRRLFYKFDLNTLNCFVQTIASIDTSGGTLKVTTENKPLINFDENSNLNFRLTINSGHFIDNSNLRLFETKKKIFTFSNNSGNKQNMQFFLSKNIPLYNAAENYITGMLVVDGADNLFEAIRESKATDAHDTTENQFWKDVTDFIQYVSQRDLVSDSENEKCFAKITISFQKNLANDFSLLKKSINPIEDNSIKGKDYLIHFKNNEAN